ncbi:MAG TPA: MBL fold metallo-hydrolase, partial [Prolixibacteraceae bacterium]|nr:MBL fold metallo-hydrolase [Prolixibacteraceae bacterium]
MEIQLFVFNPIQENTYVLWDETGECVIVDAGCYNQREFDKLDNFIQSKNLRPVKLINTHCHFDHIFGIERCREKYNLEWGAHFYDFFLTEGAESQASMFGFSIPPVASPEIKLDDNQTVCFGKSLLKVLHVPGHSPGSICFYEEESRILLTGDVLFDGSIGRTDLPGGDYETLISGIKAKLLVLPAEVDVYPGHGPATTIG